MKVVSEWSLRSLVVDRESVNVACVLVRILVNIYEF
jgi:hypothetical protein